MWKSVLESMTIDDERSWQVLGPSVEGDSVSSASISRLTVVDAPQIGDGAIFLQLECVRFDRVPIYQNRHDVKRPANTHNVVMTRCMMTVNLAVSTNAVLNMQGCGGRSRSGESRLSQRQGISSSCSSTVGNGQLN